jgi:hypothetical protein
MPKRLAVASALLVFAASAVVIIVSLASFAIDLLWIPWGQITHTAPPGVLLGRLDGPAAVAGAASTAFLIAIRWRRHA